MPTPKELVSQLEIRVSPLEEGDIVQLDPILRQHVRDRNTDEILEEEITDIKRYMRGDVDNYGRRRTFLVARDQTGKVWGCMAYSTPDPDMITHFGPDSENAAELLNAFVSTEVYRGGGIGTKLFTSVCQAAKTEGKVNLVVNSGPRYKKSWGFYDRMCDENRGYIIEKYGRGGDANTWIKHL